MGGVAIALLGAAHGRTGAGCGRSAGGRACSRRRRSRSPRAGRARGRTAGPSSWSGPNPGMSQVASNALPNSVTTWSIRTTKPQKISACMIPAGCSPVRNFLWPRPSTTIRLRRSGIRSRRAAGRAASRSRALPATIAANTSSPIAHTIGNATWLIRSPLLLWVARRGGQAGDDAMGAHDHADERRQRTPVAQEASSRGSSVAAVRASSETSVRARPVRRSARGCRRLPAAGALAGRERVRRRSAPGGLAGREAPDGAEGRSRAGRSSPSRTQSPWVGMLACAAPRPPVQGWGRGCARVPRPARRPRAGRRARGPRRSRATRA